MSQSPSIFGPLLPIIIMVVVIGGAALIGQFYAAKRRQELAEAAERLGFSFTADGDEINMWNLPHDLFQRGYDRRLFNVLEGSARGLRARVFDYSYTTGSGRNRSTQAQTVAAFQLGGGKLPGFQCYPEHFYHWIADLFGFQDIDFESDQEFSDNYRLVGPDETAIRRVFTPAVTGPLGKLTGWTLEGSGQTLLVYRPRSQVSADALAEFIDQSALLARLFAA